MPDSTPPSPGDLRFAAGRLRDIATKYGGEERAALDRVREALEQLAPMLERLGPLLEGGKFDPAALLASITPVQ